jgi:hypothetical protein
MYIIRIRDISDVIGVFPLYHLNRIRVLLPFLGAGYISLPQKDNKPFYDFLKVFE